MYKTVAVFGPKGNSQLKISQNVPPRNFDLSSTYFQNQRTHTHTHRVLWTILEQCHPRYFIVDEVVHEPIEVLI